MTEYKRVAKKVALSFSKPMPDAKLRVISLGAGVQSSVMALMAARGEVGPMPDCAIFADTQWEPAEVYAHLDWLETQLPFPVHRVTAGNIREDAIKIVEHDGVGPRPKGGQAPYFVTNKEGAAGPIRRHCTAHYKIEPIKRTVRKLVGAGPRGRIADKPIVEQWIGISTDEIQRMKMSDARHISHRWPLIEQQMSRRDCLAWFNKNYPSRSLAKSACLGCPYHADPQWREIRENAEDWNDVVQFDKKIRSGFYGMKEPTFVHRSCVPLDEVDLSTAADRGQQEFGFLEECDGMCGV